jgi:lambda family phage tail tape measure protein
LVTSSSLEVSRITKELFSVAKDTRSAFDDTAQVFTRLALSSKQLGETHDSLLSITRSLNQAVILSGANAREASNGLIQLSQAIASNRLGGDELRSVLEQLPLVTDIIGEHLVRLGLAVNGTRGEVRELGFQGRITARIIIDAFKEARDRLEKDFANTVPTITQSFIYLSTTLVELVDDFNRFSNSASVLAGSIIFLADHLRDLLNLAVLLGGAFAGVKLGALLATIVRLGKGFFAARAAMALYVAGAGSAVVGITTLTGAVKALFLALGGLPALIGLIVTGLALLANANINFFGKQNAGNESAAKEAKDALTDIMKFAPEVRAEVQAIAQEIAFVNKLLDEQDKSWIRNDEAAEAMQKNQEQLNKRLIELRKGGGKDDPNKEAKEQAELLDKIMRQLEGEFKSLQLNRRERERFVELLRIEEQLRAKDFKGDQLTNALALVEAQLKLNQSESEYREILDGLLAPQEALNIATIDYQRIIAEQPQFAEQAKRALIQYRINALEPMTDAVSGLARAQMEQQLEFSNDAKAAADAYRALTDPAMEYEQTMRALNATIAEFPALQREATVAAIDARIALLETQTTAEAGIQRGALKIQKELSDTASLTETAFVGAFQDAKSAMLDFFETGKLSTDDFINNLHRRLLDLALSGLLEKALGGALSIAGGLGGGLGGGTGGGTGGGAGSPAVFAGDPTNFARGGGFTVGGMGGTDSQMVAFRASPGERVSVQTPEQQRRGGSRPANVNIYVTTPDAKSFDRAQGHILARMGAQLSRASRRDG